MKTCTKCNIQYLEDKKFCKKCGELLISDYPTDISRISTKINSPKETIVQKKKRSNGLIIKALIIGASVIVFATIIILIIIYLKQTSAWDEANKKNTINSYQSYINEYPNGRYANEAMLKINMIKKSVSDNEVPPPPPPPSENNVGNTVVVEEDNSSNKVTKEVVGRPIFTVVEEMPSYSGGDEAREKFFTKNIKYPRLAKDNGIQGTVYVTFVVNEDGKTSDVRVLRGIGGGCDEEAIRVTKLMPAWNPGKQSGKAARVQFNMPIKFRLS